MDSLLSNSMRVNSPFQKCLKFTEICGVILHKSFFSILVTLMQCDEYMDYHLHYYFFLSPSDFIYFSYPIFNSILFLSPQTLHDLVISHVIYILICNFL